MSLVRHEGYYSVNGYNLRDGLGVDAGLEVWEKRFQLLRELIPSASTVGSCSRATTGRRSSNRMGFAAAHESQSGTDLPTLAVQKFSQAGKRMGRSRSSQLTNSGRCALAWPKARAPGDVAKDFAVHHATIARLR
jgi:hypothetical protein